MMTTDKTEKRDGIKSLHLALSLNRRMGRRPAGRPASSTVLVVTALPGTAPFSHPFLLPRLRRSQAHFRPPHRLLRGQTRDSISQWSSDATYRRNKCVRSAPVMAL